MPLHRFAIALLVSGAGAALAQPGDKAGDSSDGVWHIVKPSVTVIGVAAAPSRTC